MYMSIEEYIGERVCKGVDLLDTQIPNWREHVDYTTLDIESCTHCILGQVASGMGVVAATEWEAWSKMTERLGIRFEAGDYGFDIPDDFDTIDPDYTADEVWGMLDEAWQGVLKP